MAHRIAHAWSGILGRRVTAKDYALMMAAMKLVREASHAQPDNRDDACAYVRIAEMLDDHGPFDAETDTE